MYVMCYGFVCFFFFKQKTAYEMRISDWSSDVCSSDLSALTGSTVNLSVMDYEALASADIDLLAFSEALRTELDAHVLTFGHTLDTQVTLPQALSALAGPRHGEVAGVSGRVADGAPPRPPVPARRTHTATEHRWGKRGAGPSG